MATAAPDLIKRSCDVLGLPTTVTCAALSFHHALKAATFADTSALELRADKQRTATACIFLAAKVLEAPLRTNDLSNVVLYLFQSSELLQKEAAAAQTVGEGVQQTQHAQDQLAGDGQQQQQHADHQESGQQVPVELLSREDMLVGDAYYEHKRLLIQDEQVLLRVLRFNICIEQPHPYLLCLCRALHVPPVQARLAICCLNDALSSGLGAGSGYRTAEQAAAALHAAEIIVWPEREPDSERWKALGLAEQDVLSLSRLWLAVLRSRVGT